MMLIQIRNASDFAGVKPLSSNPLFFFQNTYKEICTSNFLFKSVDFKFLNPIVTYMLAFIFYPNCFSFL